MDVKSINYWVGYSIFYTFILYSRNKANLISMFTRFNIDGGKAGPSSTSCTKIQVV